MSLLGDDGAALFGDIFYPEYLAATLGTGDLAYDNEGRITRSSDPIDCRVQVDRATERMERAEGFTITDQAIYILAQPGGSYPAIALVESGYVVTVNEGPFAGSKFKIAPPIDRDPAGAYWLCRAVATNG